LSAVRPLFVQVPDAHHGADDTAYIATFSMLAASCGPGIGRPQKEAQYVCTSVVMASTAASKGLTPLGTRPDRAADTRASPASENGSRGAAAVATDALASGRSPAAAPLATQESTGACFAAEKLAGTMSSSAPRASTTSSAEMPRCLRA
jgi:hypothetical protein